MNLHYFRENKGRWKTQGKGKHTIKPLPKNGFAPKSRDSLRPRGGDFYRSPKNRAFFFETPRCAISSAKKIASELRFLLRRKWVKMVLAAEFRAIPSLAVKIASEWRCAILVHSVLDPPHLWYVSPPPPFVHAMSFSLIEGTGADQTNPTFWALQNWFWRACSTVRFAAHNRTIRFAPPIWPFPN